MSVNWVGMLPLVAFPTGGRHSSPVNIDRIDFRFDNRPLAEFQGEGGRYVLASEGELRGDVFV
jgi:hypothetical protein